MMERGVLIALDSVGVDPLGHDRPGSVYRDSQFLFPSGRPDTVVPVVRQRPDGSECRGLLVQTDVTGGRERGSIECALTYTSIFTGIDALDHHGLVAGLGLKDAVLESLVAESNLFRLVPSACLANAIFPLHLPFLGASYVEDLVPVASRADVEARLRLQGRPLRLRGEERHGFAELFTIAEINQNIFVHAARQADVPLKTWEDVRGGQALTGTLTGELENEFALAALGVAPIPIRTPEAAADILVQLAERHPFVFYKYQLADLVSHTGRQDLARDTFATIERFVGSLLDCIDTDETLVVVTSDHGHLEQVGFSRGHPKSLVPTWCFGSCGSQVAELLARPEGVFRVFAELAAA